MAIAPSTLLLVDDNADNRNVLARRLERHGYAVQTAASGQAALDILDRTAIDLVLLDIMMRDMDGFETLQHIRNRFSMLQLPVIMLTALSEGQNAVEALQMGANDYVTKPVDFLVMLARLRTHLVLQRLADQNDDFLRVASYDVKRALTQIQVTAEDAQTNLLMASKDEIDVPVMATMIRRIADTADSTQRRIDNFLELKMPEHGRIKDQAYLNELTRSVVSRNMEHARRKGIAIAVELDESEVPVKMYEPRLEQVVENLVDNAIKFSPEGTTTRVRTRRDGEWAVVEISDEGPGIPDPELPRVFEKYSEPLNRPTGGETGAGIALSLCKQLVEQYKGEIGVRNNDRQGATFWCRLRAG